MLVDIDFQSLYRCLPSDEEVRKYLEQNPALLNPRASVDDCIETAANLLAPLGWVAFCSNGEIRWEQEPQYIDVYTEED